MILHSSFTNPIIKLGMEIYLQLTSPIELLILPKLVLSSAKGWFFVCNFGPIQQGIDSIEICPETTYRNISCWCCGITWGNVMFWCMAQPRHILAFWRHCCCQRLSSVFHRGSDEYVQQLSSHNKFLPLEFSKIPWVTSYWWWYVRVWCTHQFLCSMSWVSFDLRCKATTKTCSETSSWNWLRASSCTASVCFRYYWHRAWATICLSLHMTTLPFRVWLQKLCKASTKLRVAQLILSSLQPSLARLRFKFVGQVQ